MTEGEKLGLERAKRAAMRLDEADTPKFKPLPEDVLPLVEITPVHQGTDILLPDG